MVFWKETAFPLCRAVEKRWKRNVVSRVPISCVSSMAILCHVSVATGLQLINLTAVAVAAVASNVYGTKSHQHS